ncbi:hypothetical protein QR685DRAFT_567709 [Neurospora intermedia]|uniref:Uncharacterized protein n=1 Tax=Neurospora intermedia TaxID=5142 RepID=A0ABR3DQ75_NEUIN
MISNMIKSISHLLKSSFFPLVRETLPVRQPLDYPLIVIKLNSTPYNCLPINMCNFFKNYYIYASCTDPGLHFYKIELDGSPQGACPRAPHERFIVKGDKCEHCQGSLPLRI